MEIPARVSVFNRTLDVKGKPGTLIDINDLGYYEINMQVQEKNHTVLFPIADTVVVFNDPLPVIDRGFEVER